MLALVFFLSLILAEECPDKFNFDSITSIGNDQYANCMTRGENIVIPETVTLIGNRAFKNCTQLLGKLTIKANIDTINEGAFQYCTGITEIILPNTITTINSKAFYGCTQLTNINIPQNIKYFNSESFAFCSELSVFGDAGETLVLGPTIVSFAEKVFYHCSSLKKIDISSLKCEIKNEAFEGCFSLACPIEFHQDINNIYANTFAYCTNITSIKLPQKITEIEYGAFYKCHNMKGNLNFNNKESSYRIIGKFAFYQCNSLETIENLDYFDKIGEFAFCQCSNLDGIIKFNKNIEIVPSHLFYGCYNIRGALVLTNKITSIDTFAFYNCSMLTINSDLNLESIKYIEDYVFYNCSSMNKKLILSNNLEYVGYYAFYNCNKLMGELNLNGDVSIQSYAFYGCSSFTGVLSLTNTDKIGKEAFGLTNFDYIKYNKYTPPICSDSIGEGLSVYAPLNYESSNFCGNKVYKDIPITYDNIDKYIMLNEDGYMDKLYLYHESNTNYEFLYIYKCDKDDMHFYDEMQFNQYIILNDAQAISYEEGHINAIANEIEINVYDCQNFSFSSKSIDKIKLNSRTYDSSEKTPDTIIITSNSTIETDTTIIVNNEVNTLSIQEISLIDKSSITCYKKNDEKIVTEFKIVNVGPHANSKIESARITDTLIINHMSSLQLSNVDLSEADIIYQLGPYHNVNNILTGTLSSIPKSFIINEPENPKVNFEKEYILIDSYFDCLKWNATLNPNSTYFEKVECIRPNSYRSRSDNLMASDRYQLKLIRKENPPPIIDDSDGSDSSGGDKDNCNKLKIGVIIGIAVACVVVVAALLIGEFFIVKKCLSKREASGNEGNEI